MGAGGFGFSGSASASAGAGNSSSGGNYVASGGFPFGSPASSFNTTLLLGVVGVGLLLIWKAKK